MKPYLFIFSSLSWLFLSSCEESSRNIQESLERKKHLSQGFFDQTSKKTGAFTVEFGDLNLRATVDDSGNVVIQNYPSEWRGKATLTRFDGEDHKENPFTKEHCEVIREKAK